MINHMQTTTPRGSLTDVLGRRLAEGSWKSGDLLVPESIAAEYGVSRPVVREAFKGLEARRMIRARHRVGTAVLPVEEWNLLDPDVIEWRSAGPDADAQLHELMALREGVEPTAVRLATVRASDEELAALSATAADLVQAFETGEIREFQAADRRFHAQIIAMTRNGALGQLLSTIDATLQTRYAATRPTFTQSTQLAVDRHVALAEGMRDRDAEGAAAVCLALITEAQVEIFRGAWP